MGRLRPSPFFSFRVLRAFAVKSLYDDQQGDTMDKEQVKIEALSAALEFLATTRNPEGTLKTTPEQVLEIATKFEAWIKKI
jgi:hypothetical protein